MEKKVPDISIPTLFWFYYSWLCIQSEVRDGWALLIMAYMQAVPKAVFIIFFFFLPLPFIQINIQIEIMITTSH